MPVSLGRKTHASTSDTVVTSDTVNIVNRRPASSQQQQQRTQRRHKQTTTTNAPTTATTQTSQTLTSPTSTSQTSTSTAQTHRFGRNTAMAPKHLIWLVWRTSGILLHMTAVCIYTFLIVRDIYLRYKSDRLAEFPGPWKFLTYWDIWIQWLTFCLCLACDCLAQNYSRSCDAAAADQQSNFVSASSAAQSSQSVKTRSLSRNSIQLDQTAAASSSSTKLADEPAGPRRLTGKLFDLRDNIITALAYPIGTFVTIMFWSIYLIDVDAIASPELRRATPMYVQHLQHTVIAPIILAEIVCCHHRVLSVRTHLITIAIFITAYLSWLLFLGNYLTIWPYPLFEKLTWWQSGPFLVCACAGAMLLYRLGLFIMKLAWPDTRIQQFYKSHMESYALSERD